MWWRTVWKPDFYWARKPTSGTEYTQLSLQPRREQPIQTLYGVLRYLQGIQLESNSHHLKEEETAVFIRRFFFHPVGQALNTLTVYHTEE